VATDGFLFTRSKDYPNAVQDFERSVNRIAALPCDILLTPHPEFTGLWDRVAKRDQGAADALVDQDACRRYAERSRAGLKTRVDRETSTGR
jgi:metallo-beta-lactamase class B